MAFAGDQQESMAHPSSVQSVVRRFLVLGMSGVFVWLTFVFVDGNEVLAQMKRLDPRWLFLGLALSVPQLFFCALRWKVTSERLGADLPLSHAWKEYYRSFFLNQILPLGIAGDAVRVGRHARKALGEQSVGVGRALSGVLLERWAGQLVLLLWIGVLLVGGAWTGTLGEGSGLALRLGGGVVALLLLLVALRLVFARFRTTAHLPARLSRALWDDGLGAFHLVVSSLVLLTLVLQYFVVARALGLPLEPERVIVFALVTLGASALPLSFAGWGAREATGGALFFAWTLAPSQGVALTVAFGLLQLASALPGCIFIAFSSALRSRERVSAPPPQTSELDGAEWFSRYHAAWVLILVGMCWLVDSAAPVAVGGGLSLLAFWASGSVEGSALRLSPANGVTALRLGLVVALGLGFFVGFGAALAVTGILLLDGLDGWLARRRNEATSLGARFDMETDALLVMTAGLVIHHEGHLGPWVLLLGLMRYVYVLALAAGALRESPPSRLGKSIFVVVATAMVLSLWPLEPIHRPLALLATFLLVYSFGASIHWSITHPARVLGLKGEAHAWEPGP